MPELPEVETIKNDLLNRELVGQKICDAQIFWSRTIHTHSPDAFINRIRGQKIANILRRAKFLVFELSHDFLAIHLRMSGRIDIESTGDQYKKHDRVILDLSNGRSIRFNDTRKFGRCYLWPDAEELEKRLGPEPLEAAFSIKYFRDALRSKKRLLKPLLLDQQFLSGLGNIYVDEALWDAKLHPESSSEKLSEENARKLRLSIRKVLKRGVKNLGTSLGKADTNFYSVGKRRGRNQDALKVFRRTGEICPRCRDHKIERIIVGQRSTHICTKCQVLKR